MRWIGAGLLILSISACDQPAPSAPGAPSPPPAPATNQPPQITAGAVSPALGIDELTTFTVRVEVSDPDGDPVSLSVTGCPFGQSTPVAVENGRATYSFKAERRGCLPWLSFTATDARGASAKATVSFEHTSLHGPYRLVIGQGFYSQPYFYVLLEQSRTVVTGTISDRYGHRGSTDPQEPGIIDADGRFRLRFKIESLPDIIVSGQVISGVESLSLDILVGSGVVTGTRYAGQQFQLWRESQY